MSIHLLGRAVTLSSPQCGSCVLVQCCPALERRGCPCHECWPRPLASRADPRLLPSFSNLLQGQDLSPRRFVLGKSSWGGVAGQTSAEFLWLKFHFLPICKNSTHSSGKLPLHPVPSAENKEPDGCPGFPLGGALGHRVLGVLVSYQGEAVRLLK